MFPVMNRPCGCHGPVASLALLYFLHICMASGLRGPALSGRRLANVFGLHGFESSPDRTAFDLKGLWILVSISTFLQFFFSDSGLPVISFHTPPGQRKFSSLAQLAWWVWAWWCPPTPRPTWPRPLSRGFIESMWFPSGFLLPDSQGGDFLPSPWHLFPSAADTATCRCATWTTTWRWGSLT